MILTTCKKLSDYPIFTPTISNLSVTTSAAGEYSLVKINGTNFLPYGSTYIKFGSISLPCIYYNSFQIGFLVPETAATGSYNIQVINIYNGNLSPRVPFVYIPNLNYSNTSEYVLL
jgi:hypothetical protein